MNRFVKTYQEIYSYALALVLFIQIVFPKLAPLAIVLLLIVVIFGAVKQQLKWKFNAMNVLLFLLYIIYLFGTFFTKDPKLAGETLEIKLSLVIFPILFSFKPTFEIGLKKIAIGMIVGVLIASSWGIYKVLSCYSNSSFIDCFPSFSDLHHPSYFAVYIVFSMALAIYGYTEKWKNFTLPLVLTYLFFGIGFSVLAFSLSGILFLFFSLSVLILLWLKKKFGKLVTAGIIAILLSLFAGLVIYSPLKEDFKYTSRSIALYFDSPEQFVKNGNRYLIGNEERLILWTVTSQLIAEHPFGVGTGNVDFYLQKRLRDYQLNVLADKNRNPHNQFLQTFLEVGIVGFLILILIIVVGLYHAVKHKNWLLLFIILSLVLNSLFESMLQRQSGIVFYTFWLCLLYLFSNSKKITNIE